jgi:hypothetical protein
LGQDFIAALNHPRRPVTRVRWSAPAAKSA